ncbi:DUF2935 domain-containing protein [Sporosarcina sp. 179-K 3D1 HS]|uniref:DUF2935 domain-containing protein n=1 Tax=Sporosarcina sp. 179-K 3D1 HS TaxID=3232169 RepID=UPI0039A2507E
MSKDFTKTARDELQFWLQILGDHGRFIHDSLAPSETTFIEQAESFISQFDSLLVDSKQNMDHRALLVLLQKARAASEMIRTFKLTILREQLVGKIKISLPPTFINHMVNEVEEAIRLFSHLEKEEMPPHVHPLHHDLLWLLDAVGHAGSIDDRLDLVEKPLKKKSRKFMKDWEAFYLKAIELTGFLRTNAAQFPALSKFHDDVHLEMTIFKAFLRELEELRLSKKGLGVLSPLMADHMAREECYYLTKLAETTEVPAPDCDPAKPRTKE